MAAIVTGESLPTTKETSVSKQITDVEDIDLPLSVDADGSKENPDAHKEQSEEDKEKLGKKLKQFISKQNVVIAMFWAPWCPHCHSAMKPFNIASQQCKKTKFLMVNAESIPRHAVQGDNAVVPLTHFPFICRLENGKVTKVYDSHPSAENIKKELVPEELDSEKTAETSSETSEALDELFH